MGKIKIKSRLGKIEINKDSIITFEKGLLGFVKEKQYCILDINPQSPLKILQSIDNPKLSFVVTNPLLFLPEYEIFVKQKDLDELEVKDLKIVDYFVIVTIPNNPSEMTANLKGPIILNHNNRKGKQLIIDNDKYSVRCRLLPEQRKVSNN